MTGPDAPDFLQRILTSDILGLAPGGGQWSALLDGKGKWVADLLVYRLEEAGTPVLCLDCPAERTAAVLEALDHYHFGEDLEWSGGNPHRLLVIGRQARTILARCGHATPSAPGGIRAIGKLLVLERPDRGLPAFEWIGPEAAWKPVRLALEKDPATVSGSLEELERIRIAAFRPRFGADFDEGSILPESGEWQRVSFTKGCYAGQEVVAKVRTFGRAPRLLCRLFFEEGAAGSFTGSVLEDLAGNRAGRVTSWTLPEGSSRAVGLGIVRRASAEEGCRLLACRGDLHAEVEIHLPPPHP